MDIYEKQKETAGTWATFVWIASGLFLYLTTEGASLFSWSALLYFIAGMFAAALVFGIAGYLVQRGLAKLLATVIKEPTANAANVVGLIGWAVLIVETVIIYLVARWVFHQIT